MGIDPDAYAGRPVIGIANSWSQLNNCNSNLRELAAAVSRGVLAAGGLPLEFPTLSLGEEFMKPSAMLYRNLARLVDLEMVVEIEVPTNARTAGGRPRFFRITALGRRACGAEAERLAGFVETARQKNLAKA